MDLGFIDLAWGDDKAGLKHIIRKHIVEHDDFGSVDEAMAAIDDVLANGDVRVQNDGVKVEKDGYRVVLARGEDGNWIVTAYDFSRKPEEKERNASSPLSSLYATTDTGQGAAQGVSAQADGVPRGEGSTSASQVQGNGVEVQEADGSANAGGGLTADEADALIGEIERHAEAAPELELTPENWRAEFGEDGVVNTPIGEVKQGDNQYLKLAQQGRNGKLGMVKPTLERPNVIIEDERPAADGNQERSTSYVFVKTFAKPDGSRYYHFASVTVSKDGREVVISSQERSVKRISKLLQQGKVAWIDSSFSLHPTTQVGQPVTLSDSNKPTIAGTQPAMLGVNSPELSTGKVGKKSVESQGASAMSRIPVDKKGKKLWHLARVEDTVWALYGSGLSDGEIDAFVAVNVEKSGKEAERAAGKPPKMGTDLDAYIRAKERWQADVKEKEEIARYWESVDAYIKEQTHTTAGECRQCVPTLTGRLRVARSMRRMV